MKTFKFAAALAAGLCLTAAAPAGAQTAPAAAPAPTAAEWRVVAPENLLVIDTSKGRVLVELEPRMAPNHVARIRELADRGFYDGLKFHRVIPDFMAQTGDPQGTGEGGSDLPNLEPEFDFRRGRGSGFQMLTTNGTAQTGVMGSMVVVTQPDAQMFVTADMKTAAHGLFCAGTLGMARASAPNSANSQFFLMTGRNEGLDGQYTPFGRVLQGLDVVRALKPGDRDQDGAVADPDVMTRVRTAAAMPEGQRPTARVVDSASASFKARVDAARANGASDACVLQPAVEIG